MIYHVLPGDAVTEEFRKADLPGDVIVCREALVSGPLDGAMPDEFWSRRAQFFVVEQGEDAILYQDTVASELERLHDIDQEDEVNLWFEYELFCSVNMWFCLSQLAGSSANIYRVEPATLGYDDRWLGFGRMSHTELRSCFDARQLFTLSDIELGSRLWEAFKTRNAEALRELAANETPRFPYLGEVVSAAAEIDERPNTVIKEIRSEGITEFAAAFPEFQRRAGVYGFGDSQVMTIWDRSI